MKSRGFTVVELLIVIIIIAILGVIALPQFINAQDRGKQSQSVANLRNVAQAMTIYAADNNGYPEADDIGDLATILQNGNYMKAVPLTDGWGQEFKVDSTNDTFILGCCGKGNDDCTLAPPAPGNTVEISTFDQQIIIRDGSFVQYPVGAQSD